MQFIVQLILDYNTIKQGAKIASGLDMYIGQAMAQFEFWTGITPSYKEMERFSKEAILLRGDKTEN